MTRTAAPATFLLPARARFGGQALSPAFAKALGRADRTDGEPGERAQLLRHFDLLPRGWPVAAITRAFDSNDATLGAWLRADPAFVRPDLNGARLLACGDALQMTQAEADAFLSALRPLFGDSGMPIDAPRPARWYLRLPREAKLPSMASPEEALGADLFDHLPEGPEGRRWRALLSEAQVALHQHPLNAQRQAEGKPPVNSLWFWGGGVVPDHVTTSHARVHSNEVTLRALTKAAKVDGGDVPANFDGAGLIDLRPLRDLRAFETKWLEPAMAQLRSGALTAIHLDHDDGARFTLLPNHRWRFWRKPLKAFDA
ncbi:Regulatory protein RpfE type [Lysobacter dokdonensis DS-58]|uniref:Regulatory protein RpfE type n=1 Tax=Lysobacter dokdonensis DS-58 TaxID=1300345 RepID=A0A0A2WJ74_9GAMM|nr:phosphoglycerate mutase [Lysobacter dokdonensis]KGQ20211.1 Regulatory protein RpfE type [Lysobacter dokdonensis DS-58]